MHVLESDYCRQELVVPSASARLLKLWVFHILYARFYPIVFTHKKNSKGTKPLWLLHIFLLFTIKTFPLIRLLVQSHMHVGNDIIQNYHMPQPYEDGFKRHSFRVPSGLEKENTTQLVGISYKIAPCKTTPFSNQTVCISHYASTK